MTKLFNNKKVTENVNEFHSIKHFCKSGSNDNVLY